MLRVRTAAGWEVDTEEGEQRRLYDVEGLFCDEVDKERVLGGGSQTVRRLRRGVLFCGLWSLGLGALGSPTLAWRKSVSWLDCKRQLSQSHAASRPQVACRCPMKQRPSNAFGLQAGPNDLRKASLRGWFLLPTSPFYCVPRACMYK